MLHTCTIMEGKDIVSSIVWFIIFTILWISVLTVYNALAFETDLENDQQAVREETGMYFSDFTNPQFTIHTYETVCKGYYTIEDTPEALIYTGYGDLSSNYTFEIQKPTKSIVSSTTLDIISSVSTTSDISI